MDPNGEVTGRIVNETQAVIVWRVLNDYADGATPRAIADGLNREGVLGAGGRPWNVSMMRGHRGRGSGMVNNELYVGELVWNRQRFVRHPETGRRVSQIKPRERMGEAERAGTADRERPPQDHHR